MKATPTLPSSAGLAALLASVALTGQSEAALTFVDDFDGTTLDPGWTQGGTASGHAGLNGMGQYILCSTSGAGGSELSWSTGGMPQSFTAELDVSMNPFLTPNQSTDVKWRFFGPSGFVEVVTNSFGSIRVFSSAAGGNIGGPTTIAGFTDGDTLNLSLDYNDPTDTLTITYALNGGAATNLATYTGAGNFYTNKADVQAFNFGTGTEAKVAIDRFSIAIPEPSKALLLGLGIVALGLKRRRVSQG